MKKEVLNIERERERLSPLNKKYWDDVRNDIDVICEKLNLNAKQKEALIQGAMAEIRHAHIVEENKYLSRTQDSTAKRAINRNKLEMQRMKHVYEDNYSVLKDFEKQAAEMFVQLRQEREKNKNKKRNNNI